MRIESIQNFTATALDKCCRPRKSNENTPSNNNLERSPIMDIVSFGKFDERYKKTTEHHVGIKLINNRAYYRVLRDCIYLNLRPVDATKQDFENSEYKLELVSLREFRPDDETWVIKQSDELMQSHIDDFNEMHGLKSGWEKHLRTTEDFEKAAQLANYLDNNGYFPRHDDDHEEPLDMFNIHDRGYAT